MKYSINENLSITVNDKGQASKNDVACLLAVIAGLRHDPETSTGAANIFVGEDSTRYWVPKTVAPGAEPDFSDFASMMQLAPHNNPAFCQALMRKLGLVVSPVLMEHGHLVGAWKVEHVAYYGATNFKEHGWQHGTNEPVQEVSSNLFEAICRAALRVAGVGRRAYLFSPEENSPDAMLIYLSDWVRDWIIHNTSDSDRLKAIPPLDSYAICGISEDGAQRIITEALKGAQTAESSPLPDFHKSPEPSSDVAVATDSVESGPIATE